MGVKIKTEFLNTVIGFNNSALPLGERNDLHILAKMAQESNDTSLLNLFEELPNQEEIQAEKVEKLLEETADAITPEKKPRNNKKQTESETDSAE
ncbi:hypothetical protein [Elizabethkingia anophelis]|uniref:hypothetical protein n=1 Tax=Elizabethkingia anophelis TaxID=1117645 RepID=UPI002012E4F5|nr:hypothetical protein [Elizabethkingia anophelis]MCL1690835.1 hypothetical protein [Elizabethkingia anophelis]